MKLMRPRFGPAAELPASQPAWRRHGGCSSPVGALDLLGGNRRAASASARGTGRTAYINLSTLDGMTNHRRTLLAGILILAAVGGGGGCPMYTYSLEGSVRHAALPVADASVTVQVEAKKRRSPHELTRMVTFGSA